MVQWWGLYESHHWIALRSFEGGWFNLDSCLREPVPFDGADGAPGFVDSGAPPPLSAHSEAFGRGAMAQV